jgi:protein-disulfide isomerase
VKRRKFFFLAGSVLALSLGVLCGGAKLLARASGPASAGITGEDTHQAFGSKSAPIIMEVFTDYQCPSCREFYLTTNQQLMDNYVDLGKLYLIHRDFPLPMHAYSKIAAHYARAAAQIGKFEPVAQALYQNQPTWEQNGNVDGTVASVLSSAEMTKVRALAKSNTFDAAIAKDVELARQYNVNQTPTSIIHCKGQTYPVVGYVSYDVLHQFLDELLAQK